MTKVYLAGGFLSNWQEEISKLEGFVFFNPRTKEKSVKTDVKMTCNEYVAWDLHYIKMSDIVFVYAESTNDSCIGLSAEIGYAKGLGKTVIAVIEPNNIRIKDKYFDFIRRMSDVHYDTLKEGIEFLTHFK